mgnify:CR=1 FL=1|tara:strand:+ start:8 stop:571 length:564 start_codon:yes stop_codon:yes gene_type:complete
MSTNIPEKVEVNTEDGIDPQSLVLATQFMAKVGDLARLTRRRGQLSHLYLCTMASWADKEVLDDVSNQRHFSQILYALGHGLHVVRVVGDGRSLVWNRYRDNVGNEVDRDDVEHRSSTGRGGSSTGRGGSSNGHNRSHGSHERSRGGYHGSRVNVGRSDEGQDNSFDSRSNRYKKGGDGDRRTNGSE